MNLLKSLNCAIEYLRWENFMVDKLYPNKAIREKKCYERPKDKAGIPKFETICSWMSREPAATFLQVPKSLRSTYC